MKKSNTKLQKITPFLWFNENAEEAVEFYVSIFENSRIGDIVRYNVEGSKLSGRAEGSVMTVNFWLEGQEFVALNGGPQFQFNHSISFVVNCDSQKDIDFYHEKLSAGGKEEPCGWVKDKFGVSWQIVPTLLKEYLKDGTGRGEKVIEAMGKMMKIDIDKLSEIYTGSKPVNKPMSAARRKRRIISSKL
jgi:predicted 3-demethylubiquinone-9 3-methyltransferase (glyoxalase superfamily)